MLDDTSFSGATSTVVERLIRQSLPERELKFAHGFLILNEGELGPQPGAKQVLHALGSQAVAGMTMRTPVDDGWHFFDIVKQPTVLTQCDLVTAHVAGRFVADGNIAAGMHMRNPQLLPSIIASGHILPPEEWRQDVEPTLKHLQNLQTLLGAQDEK